MGYSYSPSDKSRMCYNAPKSVQLGWYNDRVVDWDSSRSEWSGYLYGIADYRTTTPDKKMILYIENTERNEDIYVSFNRKSGMNDGTKEGADQVLIHSKSPGGKCKGETSYLESKLNPGESYTISGTSITIQFESRHESGGYMFAQVVVKDSSNSSNSCNDSPLRFRTVIKGKNVAKNCDWAGKRSTNIRCRFENVASMCPETCTSTDNTCNNGMARFKFDYNGDTIMRSCIWVEKRNTEERCKIHGIKDTCRETCRPYF